MIRWGGQARTGAAVQCLGMEQARGAGAVGVSCLLLIFSYFYRIQPGRNAAYTEDQSGEGKTPASPGTPQSEPQRARQRTA